VTNVSISRNLAEILDMNETFTITYFQEIVITFATLKPHADIFASMITCCVTFFTASLQPLIVALMNKVFKIPYQ